MLIPLARFAGSGGLAHIHLDAAIVDAPVLLSEVAPSSREGEEILNPLLAAWSGSRENPAQRLKGIHNIKTLLRTRTHRNKS